MREVHFEDAKAVAKRAFFLAWLACDGPEGMGMLQDRPDSTEEDVWKNIQGADDYPGEHIPEMKKEGVSLSSDYVFGRMMKLRLIVGAKRITFDDESKLTADYQAWCPVYPTIFHLLEEAEHQLDKEKVDA